jgi:hypothetical protein
MQEIIYNAFLTRLDGSTTPVKPKKFKRKFMDKYGKNLTKPIEAQEYAEILKEVKNNKAPGPHSIKGELIKNGGFTLNSYMRIWINKMLYQGRVPHKLKQGKVKLLYKKGGTLDALNYRPLTLSSVLLKILTRILNTRLMNLLETENLLSNCQFGFRKKKSTQDALLILSTVIEKARQNKDDALLTFIDLKAAYDKVPTEITTH